VRNILSLLLLQVLIDGRDLRDYNIKWLRQHIGVVSQEPVLFDTTIKENISFGRDGATQEEIEAACRKSNAHSFIMKLPKVRSTFQKARSS
jgi:ATP-binding cassette subfamily B (MDR/TAP) protein 1